MLPLKLIFLRLFLIILPLERNSISRFKFILDLLIKFVIKELIIITKVIFTGFQFLIPIFIFIIIANLMGIVPICFTIFSHLLFRLPCRILIWVGIIVYFRIIKGWILLLHYIPKNCPWILLPLLVIVEIIREIIRPITLRIRLTANLIAGHLLITIIITVNFNIFLKFLLALTIIPIVLLEVGVCVIQSYVFVILRLLYFEEK